MMNLPRALFLLLFFSAFSFPLSAFAQGSLAPPPGAPTPTMKSLDQIEPRTPISSLPFTISAPGSYYLTSNLSVTSGDAITINASGVTLDLNGFTISSSSNTATGMGINLIRPNRDITILNGHIEGSVTYSGTFTSGPGFQNGIGFSGATIQLQNVRVSGVSVSGVNSNGIVPSGDSTVIDHCEVRTVGLTGISGNSVTECVVNISGGTGISAVVVANSRAVVVGSATAISATTANNCLGDSDTGTGIVAQNATNCWGRSSASGTTATGLDAQRAENCTGFSDAGTGLNATTAINSFGAAGSGAGLNATNATSCFGSSSTYRGLSATSANNCQGSSTNGFGLTASNALNCYGISTTGVGLNADYLASGCYGKTSGGNTYGIQTKIAQNCYGDYEGNGVQAFAIYASEMAIGCSGNNTFTTRIILTNIAYCCTGSLISSQHQYFCGSGPATYP